MSRPARRGKACYQLILAKERRHAPIQTQIRRPGESGGSGPAVLTEPVQHGRALPAWGAPGSSTLGTAKHATLRTVLIGPRIVGFWEYDLDARHIVYATFEKSAHQPALLTAAESLTTLLRDELQHGRSFNLDTDDELRARTTLVQQVSL